MAEKLNRRRFLQSTGGLVLSGVGLGSGLISCASFDRSFLESNFPDETVAIVGGGVGGLYLAYQCKMQKRPFVLFEASNRLGGRIMTADGFEWGAYEFSNRDERLRRLIGDLKIETQKLDSETWSIKPGASQLITALQSRAADLLSHRQIRMSHELILIERRSNSVDLKFKDPKGLLQTFNFKHVVLAMPLNRVLQVRGLEDFNRDRFNVADIRKSLQVRTAIRWNKPLTQMRGSKSRANPVMLAEYERDIWIKARYQSDRIVFTITGPDRDVALDLSSIEKRISKDFLLLKKSEIQQMPSQMLNWSSVRFIESCYSFLEPLSNSNLDLLKIDWNWFGSESSLQIMADGTASKLARVESVIRQAQEAADRVALYS